jgi:hypothetical protein
MGGVPPLGYRASDYKLVMTESEVETVRHIFGRYAARGSVRLPQQELEAHGTRQQKDERKPMQLRPMLAALIQRIISYASTGSTFSCCQTESLPCCVMGRQTWADTADDEEQPLVLTVPARMGFGIRMLIDEAAPPGRATRPDPKLIKLIARAHLLNNKLAESGSEHLVELAQRQRLTNSYFTRVLRLTYLAPDITRAILEGAILATSPPKSCSPIRRDHRSGSSGSPTSRARDRRGSDHARRSHCPGNRQGPAR